MISRLAKPAAFLALLLPAFGQDTEADVSNDTKSEEHKLESSHVSALKFRCIGPALMSGRITEIAIDPEVRSTWYVAAASGGVWKIVHFQRATGQPIPKDE